MIAPSQIPNLKVKPRWQAPVGVMESVVSYNCRKYGMPRPVLALPLWEGAGNRAVDLSGHGNHGTLIDGPKWVADGLCFDSAVNCVVTVADTDVLRLHDLSFAGWYYIYPGGVRRGLLGRQYGDESGNSLILYIRESTDEYRLYAIMGGSALHINTSVVLPENEWVHIGYTYDHAHMRFYVNGAEVMQQAETRNITYTTGNPWIMCADQNTSSDFSNFFHGLLSGVQMFDTALSPSQIKFLHDDPYFMFRMPEELYGYSPAAVGAIMNQFQKHNVGADLYNGAIIA